MECIHHSESIVIVLLYVALYFPQAYAFVAIITFLVLLSCGSCVHESKADLDDARNQLRELLLQEINDANAQLPENTGKLQYS